MRENLYATQFHPELDVAGTVERVQIYRDAGYFPPDEMSRVIEALRTSHVEHPPRLLEAFVRRYAR
jgi:GMP synthase (glutamine-hydrolysing)